MNGPRLRLARKPSQLPQTATTLFIRRPSATVPAMTAFEVALPREYVCRHSAPSRRTVTVIGRLALRPTLEINCSGIVIGSPLIARITSPAFMPPFSAGSPGLTRGTFGCMFGNTPMSPISKRLSAAGIGVT